MRVQYRSYFPVRGGPEDAEITAILYEHFRDLTGFYPVAVSIPVMPGYPVSLPALFKAVSERNNVQKMDKIEVEDFVRCPGNSPRKLQLSRSKLPVGFSLRHRHRGPLIMKYHEQV